MKHFCDGIHGKAMAVEKDGECFLCEGSPAIDRVFYPLIVAVFTLIPLSFGDTSIFDEVFVLTSWAVHRCLLLVVFLWMWLSQDSVFVCVCPEKNRSDFFLDIFPEKG